jgi:hypothetical protein
MLWVNKDVEAEQIPTGSPDMTAAILKLPDRRVLVVSVYVPKQDPQALRSACNDFHKIITDIRRNAGTTVDVVIAGDFNRHDQLWGGEDVSLERQGEADRIIDLMNEFMCKAGVRKKTEYKQLPSGYAEALENTHFILVATVQKLYSMLRNGDKWELGGPELNDRGQPIVHNVASKLGCLRHTADILSQLGNLLIQRRKSLPRRPEPLPCRYPFCHSNTYLFCREKKLRTLGKISHLGTYPFCHSDTYLFCRQKKLCT